MFPGGYAYNKARPGNSVVTDGILERIQQGKERNATLKVAAHTRHKNNKFKIIYMSGNCFTTWVNTSLPGTQLMELLKHSPVRYVLWFLVSHRLLSKSNKYRGKSWLLTVLTECQILNCKLWQLLGSLQKDKTE